MDLRYQSTRGEGRALLASEVVLKGLADDGGLFVPTSIPELGLDLRNLRKMDYRQTAFAVMRRYLTDYTEAELWACVCQAYDGKFDTPKIAPVKEAGGMYYLELFHGATLAFKDMALSILPHLLTTAARKQGDTRETVILTATSGDTGKAALAGFADVPGTRVIVFYPKDGVSPIQERQMVTQKGSNTFVVGIRGNFDDAQAGVKRIFGNAALAREMDSAGYRFSSANSINIGRLVPQVAYYVYAYGRLLAMGALQEGQRMDVAVPTGNFGNILAAYYAKKMGLPIGKLLCASNDNKVLFDFFQTGEYDRNRAFFLTSSPSMDILISSNLERLIYEIAGDAGENRARMEQLEREGRYAITAKMRARLADFAGGFATGEEVTEEIRRVYAQASYVLDPHTAVASCVNRKYRQAGGKEGLSLVVSTASPYKFAQTVLSAIDPAFAQTSRSAIDPAQDQAGDFAMVDRLSHILGQPVPEPIEQMRHAPVLHDTVVEIGEMETAVRRILGMA